MIMRWSTDMTDGQGGLGIVRTHSSIYTNARGGEAMTVTKNKSNGEYDNEVEDRHGRQTGKTVSYGVDKLNQTSKCNI